MKEIHNVNIVHEFPLPIPFDIRAELPVTPEISEFVWKSRETVRNIIQHKDKRILLLCGPCSIDSVPAALEYASLFRSIRDEVSDVFFPVMRAYFEKPRTTIGWKGLVYDPDLDTSFRIEKGLRLTRKLLLELANLSLPVATEVLEPIIPQYIADLISWASIGARTSESQTHRQLASGLSMPVGFKNSTDGSIPVAVDAIRTASASHSFLGVIDDGRTGVFQTRGNPDCHLVLRGGMNSPNYQSEHIAFARELMRREKVNPAKQGEIMMDVLSQFKNGETSIRGVMLESYIKNGNQPIAKKGQMIPGLSVTDPCLGWQETKDLILKSAEFLRKG